MEIVKASTKVPFHRLSKGIEYENCDIVGRFDPRKRKVTFLSVPQDLQDLDGFLLASSHE
jgi:hypothetical protein